MEMASISKSLLFSFIVFLFSRSAYSQNYDEFLQCLSLRLSNDSAIFDIVYIRNDSSFVPILQLTIRNLRFTDPSTPIPPIIVTPVNESQIQATVLCSKESKLQIRTRSGGHDFEGISYTSQVPFILIDLIRLGEIVIDIEQKTAWVQTGSTIGQLYYKISQQSNTLAFPAGTCPTVGVGGHFSGGGYGTLFRKYGLAADNVVDARLVDVNGEVLDRKSMGEELFWAIRGGGAASFGVITAWKINLVDVPEIVTIFSISRTHEQNATELIHQWQYVAPNLPNDIYNSVFIGRINSSQTGELTIQATFNSMYLGGANELVELLEEKFPELGVRREDCNEVSWVQSVLSYGGYPVDTPPEILASTDSLYTTYFKGKSDYVQEPIPTNGLEGIWRFLLEEETGVVVLIAYGGEMNEISKSATPFPYRAGNLYKILHSISWAEPGLEASERHINWTRRLYDHATPYVSKNPRSAYLNYRDLDIGVNNNEDNTSYAQASVWGLKYFNNNFNRLVRVKTMVDPSNFFRHEQSIPPLLYQSSKNKTIKGQ